MTLLDVDPFSLPVPWPVLLGLVLAAFVAGWVDAVVGGGGLIQLPALLIGLPKDVPSPVIIGTNKISSAAGTVIATATYARRVAMDGRTLAPLVVFSFVGSVVGSSLARLLPKAALTPIVLVALVAVGAYTWFKPQLGMVHQQRHTGWRHSAYTGAIGLGVGTYDGLLGPGTGSFFVILMVAVLGYGFLEASAKAKVANLATNVAAMVVFGLHGELLWLLGGCMAAANLVGGFLGARTAINRGNGFVRTVFLVVVGVLICKLSYDTAVQLL